MSILTITGEDLRGGVQDIPDGKYLGDVQAAEFGDTPFGSGITIQLGNLTTRDGQTVVQNGHGTVNIGARKAFVDIATDSQDEWRVEKGMRLVKQLAVASGLAAKPEKGKTTEFAFNIEQFSSQIVGKTSVPFVLRTRSWKDVTTGEDRKRQYVVAFEAP